jgi:hypothetical protein
VHVVRAELLPYLRTPVEGGYYYNPAGPTAPMFTDFPPAVGDLLSLPDDRRVFRVLARHWEHAHTGSMTARTDGDRQRTRLTLLLEEAGGLFVDEVSQPDEELTA